MYGYEVECVFAAVEYDQRDAAAGYAGEYGGYGAGVLGGFGGVMYGYGECCGWGGELCGPECQRGEWDGGWGLDGFGLRLISRLSILSSQFFRPAEEFMLVWF